MPFPIRRCHFPTLDGRHPSKQSITQCVVWRDMVFGLCSPSLFSHSLTLLVALWSWLLVPEAISEFPRKRRKPSFSSRNDNLPNSTQPTHPILISNTSSTVLLSTALTPPIAPVTTATAETPSPSPSPPSLITTSTPHSSTRTYIPNFLPDFPLPHTYKNSPVSFLTNVNNCEHFSQLPFCLPIVRFLQKHPKTLEKSKKRNAKKNTI